MSDKRKCMSCGAEMPNGVWVCPACHARAVDDTELFESIFRQPSAEEQQQVQPRRRMREPAETDEEQVLRGQFWRIIVVLSVLALMIVAAVVVFIVMQNRSTSDVPVESTDTIHLIDEDGTEVSATDAPQAVEPEEEATASDAAGTEEAAEEELVEKDETLYVDQSGANLRAEPSTTSSILMSLPNGTELHCTGVQGNWCRVEYDGTVGYISVAVVVDSADQVTEEETTAEVAEGHDAVKITSKANARSGAGTNYSVVAVLDVGTVLERVSVSGSWSCVLYNGQEVYVHNNMLTVTDEALTASGSSSAAQTEEKAAADDTEAADDDAEDETAEKTGTIVSKANVRSGAGTKYSVVGVLEAGAVVTVGTETGGWYSITAEDGTEGYVYSSLLTIK